MFSGPLSYRVFRETGPGTLSGQTPTLSPPAKNSKYFTNDQKETVDDSEISKICEQETRTSKDFHMYMKLKEERW